MSEALRFLLFVAAIAALRAALAYFGALPMH